MKKLYEKIIRFFTTQTIPSQIIPLRLTIVANVKIDLEKQITQSINNKKKVLMEFYLLHLHHLDQIKLNLFRSWCDKR